MASGHTAVYTERKTEQIETMKIKLGNLLPLQEAKLSIQLVFKISIECGSYLFKLPVDFYPNYSKIGAPIKHVYTFNFTLNIKSTKRITQISIPSNAECNIDENGTSAFIKITEPACKEIFAYYKTSEMMYPQLVYAEDPQFPDEVVVSASLVPTLEPPAP